MTPRRGNIRQPGVAPRVKRNGAIAPGIDWGIIPGNWSSPREIMG